MNYKDILGFSSKKNKKVIKEKVEKPSVKDILEEEFRPTAKAFGNRNVQMKTDTGPKRWTGSGLTEFEQQGGKDNVNEGPAAEYNQAHQKVKKAYYEFTDAYYEFTRLLIKKGLKPVGRAIDKQFGGVEKWWKFYNKMLDKLL